MGRSTKTQAIENRARIVAVANSLFRANEISPIGIADVMNAAGMTQGGFYKHFSTRDALAAEACSFASSEAAQRWRDIIEKAMQQKMSPSDAIMEHNLAPKLADMTCPMVAFTDDAFRRPKGGPLHIAYELGVDVLFSIFADATSSQGNTTRREEPARLQFAGMVGAKMLARAVCTQLWTKF